MEFSSVSCGRVGVIDYGFGNVTSVLNALAKVELTAEVVTNPDEIRNYEDLVLPGVGAFPSAMSVIRDRGLDVAIRAAADAGANLLGICLGMQLLFEESTEFGVTQGLGLLPGRVEPLVSKDKLSVGLKSTHIAWATVSQVGQTDLAKWLELRAADFYFVHSYAVKPDNFEHIAGESSFMGNCFVAAVQSGNVAGVQFHPERSREVGLELLSHLFRREASAGSRLSK